jgi:hypothetical protein
MLEKTVNLAIDDAYLQLKAALLGKGCKVISEKSPESIVVKQGSLWGISPKTAKKTLTCNLKPTGSGAQITCLSKLSADWINLTLIGTALSIVIVGLCVWISLDLDAFLVTNQPSVWSWIASAGNFVDYQLGDSLVNLTRALALFLSAMIGIEVVIAFYAHSRIDVFAKDALLDT